MNPSDHKIFFILDSFPPRAIKAWIKYHEELLEYTAEHFSWFAHQRSKMIDELKKTLLENTQSFQFKKYVRIVSQQFSNQPLSTIGSVKSFPGGRFNIGTIDSERFPQFPALYLAEDSATAFLEMTGIKTEKKSDGLSANELSMAGNFSHFVINGNLTSVLDLTKPESLKLFYKQLKEIKLPIYYKRKAAGLKIDPMLPVNSLEQLKQTIFEDNWRMMPMQFDTPANSQILGQIAYSAGIEAIIYPSNKSGKIALAIYPENFASSEAFIEIEGEVANTVEHKRIDKDTYKLFLPG